MTRSSRSTVGVLILAGAFTFLAWRLFAPVMLHVLGTNVSCGPAVTATVVSFDHGTDAADLTASCNQNARVTVLQSFAVFAVIATAGVVVIAFGQSDRARRATVVPPRPPAPPRARGVVPPPPAPPVPLRTFQSPPRPPFPF